MSAACKSAKGLCLLLLQQLFIVGISMLAAQMAYRRLGWSLLATFAAVGLLLTIALYPVTKRMNRI